MRPGSVVVIVIVELPSCDCSSVELLGSDFEASDSVSEVCDRVVVLGCVLGVLWSVATDHLWLLIELWSRSSDTVVGCASVAEYAVYGCGSGENYVICPLNAEGSP